MAKINVACGPFGNIYAGTSIKPGVWGPGKRDVTIDALVAVVEHVIHFGEPVVISSTDGVHQYKITVEKLG